ncbi:hypothetical protein RRG08_010473 [Elysia crispata]|uniref:Uncharacterized protein n=1 Tax=Elysia crispata TaxID=231223 RepID=A0AAE1E1P4_9GAST|nr:hypothetical protein RRG08_010473 [Elysia crispata]
MTAVRHLQIRLNPLDEFPTNVTEEESIKPSKQAPTISGQWAANIRERVPFPPLCSQRVRSNEIEIDPTTLLHKL